MTEEQRHLQGHHRRGSMRLYSRDDTAGQLALQATLILQVRKGYRFVTPLHRGSQTPLVEPAVTLEGYRKSIQNFIGHFSTSIELRKIRLSMVFQHQCQKNPCMLTMTVTAAVPQNLHRVPHPLQKSVELKMI